MLYIYNKHNNVNAKKCFYAAKTVNPAPTSCLNADAASTVSDVT